MAGALEDLHIEGLGHNSPFLSAVMDQPRFQEGRLSTGYIAEEFPDGFHGLAPTPRQLDLMTAVACAMQRIQARRNGRTHAVLAAPKPRADWVVVGRSRQAPRCGSPTSSGGLEIVLVGEDRAVRLTVDRLAARPGAVPRRAGRRAVRRRGRRRPPKASASATAPRAPRCWC